MAFRPHSTFPPGMTRIFFHVARAPTCRPISADRKTGREKPNVIDPRPPTQASRVAIPASTLAIKSTPKAPLTVPETLVDPLSSVSQVHEPSMDGVKTARA